MTEYTVQDLLNLEKYQQLAHEAQEAANLIKEHFSSTFGLDNTSVHVYHTESFGEYYGDATLSIDGKWHYHDNWWGGRDWTIDVTADGIFTLLCEAYLIETNQPHTMELADTPSNHFRHFIEDIKQKNN